MKVREWVEAHRTKVAGVATAAVTVVGTALPALAAGESSGGGSLSNVVVSSDMLDGLIDGITANISVGMPGAFTIMGILIGIGVIIALIRRAVRN